MTAPPSSFCSRGGGDPVEQAPSEHGDSPTSDGAVGGTLGDSGRKGFERVGKDTSAPLRPPIYNAEAALQHDLNYSLHD